MKVEVTKSLAAIAYRQEKVERYICELLSFLQVNLTGRYSLTGYDKHYQTYLLALGVPMQAVHKILNT